MDLRLELVAVPVPDVEDLPWGRFLFFSDPDGNRWALQQLPDGSRDAGGSGAPREG